VSVLCFLPVKVLGKVLEIQKEVDIIRDDIEKEFLQCLDELG
jgi:hypothetical protein